MPVLNRNKKTVPDATGAGSMEYTRAIKIDPNSGLFSATIPEHLHATAALVSPEQIFVHTSGSGEKWCRLDYFSEGKFAGEVTAKSRDEVVDAWDRLIYRCREYLTSRVKTKVILLTTEMNVAIFDAEGKVVFRRSDVSFGKTSPLVGVQYRVCYEAGDYLVDDENRQVYRGENDVVIPHTPEREVFLQNIVDTFEKAALQLHEFGNLVKEDPLSIEGVMKRGLLLPGR